VATATIGANPVQAKGLTATGAQVFQQAGPIAGASEAGDHFRESLASRDFNADRYEDLASHVPDDDSSGIVNGSAVQLSVSGNPELPVV